MDWYCILNDDGLMKQINVLRGDESVNGFEAHTMVTIQYKIICD